MGTSDHLPNKCVLYAQFIYSTRRLRFSSFGEHACIFKDPAWDILLNLYISQHKGIKVIKTDAAVSGETPEATGFRVIKDLEKRGLVKSVNDFPGKKRVFVSLTEQARVLIEKTLNLEL